jgi:predicted SAM-dependent methyltransferase
VITRFYHCTICNRRLKQKLLTLKLSFANRRARYLLRQKVKTLKRQGKPIKIVVGAASTAYPDWLSTDLPTLDALDSAQWNYIFPRGSIEKILAEHVVEHWAETEFRLFLRTVRPFLSKGGYVRIAVPDGYHPDPSYIDYVKPGGTGIGADDHKVLYNYISISRVLAEEQYDFDPLEYFDEKGIFHQSPWKAEDGFVARSADFDSRNKEKPLSYTSLIVDARPRL